jgi:hypothetical protein
MTVKNPIATGVSLIALGIFLLITSHARGAEIQPPEADDQTAYFFPDIPDREVINWALKRAYQLNGNSMVGYDKMVDLSKEKPFSVVVRTEKMTVTIPATPPKPEEQLAQLKPVRPSDVCTKHGMHKVITGSSWRCRK